MASEAGTLVVAKAWAVRKGAGGRAMYTPGTIRRFCKIRCWLAAHTVLPPTHSYTRHLACPDIRANRNLKKKGHTTLPNICINNVM